MELLASSNNLSDLVDKQQYYSSLRNKVSGNLDAVQKVKTQLQGLNIQLLSRQNEENLEIRAIAQKQSEVQALLDETKGQEAALSAIG